MNIVSRFMEYFCPLSTPEEKISVEEIVKKSNDFEKKIESVEVPPIKDWPNVHFGD